jgi:flagellar hook-length control protein FliK
MTPGAILTSSLLPVAAAGVVAPGRASASGPFAVPTDDPGAPGESADATVKAKDGTKADAAEDAGKPGTDKAESDAADEQSADGALDAQLAAAQAAMAGAAALAAQPLTIHTLNGLLLTVPAQALPEARAQFAARTGADAPPDQRPAAGPQPQRSGDPQTTSRAHDASEASGQTVRSEAETSQREQPQRDPGASTPSRERAAAGRAGPEQPGPQPVERAGPRPVHTVVPGFGASAPAGEARTANPPSGTIGVRLGVVEGVGGTRAAAGPKSGAFSAPTERTGPAQVVRGVVAAVNQKGGKVTLDLSPGELGKMRVELKLDARSAVATFHVESPEARRLLEEALPQLRQALTDRGLSLERAEVVVPGVDLPGATAALQGGVQALALVAPEDLDPRTPGERDPEPGDRHDAPGHDARDGADGGGDQDDAGRVPGRVSIIGPDGVDVVA